MGRATIRGGTKIVVFRTKTDKLLDQDDPTSGTAYEVLPLTTNCRVVSAVIQTTSSAAPTTMDLIFTIDGQTIQHSASSPTSTSWYYPVPDPDAAAASQVLSKTLTFIHRAFLYEGRSVKVEAKTTGGTVSNLKCRVKYAKR